jgi:signal transduction histidine kinase
MSLLLKTQIPEKYMERIKKRVTFIVFDRCGWIIPAAMSIFVVFLILVVVTSLWDSGSRRFIYLNTIALLNFGLIYLFYKKHSVEKEENINKSHFFLQNVTAGSLFLWGAVITAFDANTTLGNSTYIVCILIVGSLICLKPGILILMFICGEVIIHTIAEIFGRSFILSDMIQETVIYVVVVFVALIINRFNVSVIVKTFLLEQDLEERVEERTSQLAVEAEKAKHSDMLKTAFLANMSHEIRTPLNGILGFSNLLNDDEIEPDIRKKYVATIINSGNTLLEILSGIIELSRIESGVCEVTTEEFCINDILQEVIDSFGGNMKISSGKIKLINREENSEPVIIVSDRLKIVQILINLINNAVKYTDSGIISIGFSFSGVDEIEIFVKDTGRGIKEDDYKMIFERFHQSELDPYKRGEGVGLGLTIVKGYTELLKGEIRVESEPGNGSTFSLKIPVRYSES